MSNKTNFKRIALAVVAALGFGVLASAPSNAVIVAHSIVLDPTTAQTAAVSTTVGTATTVYVKSAFTGTAAADSVTVFAALAKPLTSSASGTLAFHTDSSNATAAAAAAAGYTPTNLGSASYMVYSYAITPDVAGTYTVSFSGIGKDNTTVGPVTITITAAAKNVTPSATYSKVALTGGADSATISAATPSFTADSAIVVTRGTASSPAVVAKLSFDQRNSADTNVVTGTDVYESVTVSVTGPGLLSLNNSATRLRAVTTVLKSDTVLVWSDGTAGVATLNISTASLPTWTTKTLTFAGALASASLTASKTTTAAGNSDTSTVLRAVLKDSGDNLVTSATTMYIHSSDTKVVDNASCSVTVSASLGYGNCALKIVDSGTAKVKIANYAFGATVPTTPIVSNEVDIIIAGAAAKVAIAFDKRTYVPGEKAVITVTVTDGLGRGVADQAIVSLFATGGITVSPALTSGTVSGETVTVTAATHGQGAFKYTVNMPSIGGQVIASATGGTGLVAAGRVAVADTVTVTDPAEDAANSALDAAQEATDAAIAATDAAILAQEAADEAASAAIAAQETAQAAVDAVTALSAEVTKLVAQLATLQKLLNRVAKRVGVKL